MAPSDSFEFKKSDLETDSSIWALYEKWCVHHEKPRTPQEMQKRFYYFKMHAKLVYEHNNNKSNFPDFCINLFGDGDLPCCCRGSVSPIRTRSPFEFDKGDLESDETVWALYEKWRRHEEIERTPKEMMTRFSIFKENAECIYEHNVMCPYSKLDLGAFGDHDDEDSSWVRGYVRLIRRDNLIKRFMYYFCFTFLLVILFTLLTVIWFT